MASDSVFSENAVNVCPYILCISDVCFFTGSETECIGNFKLLFSLLRIHGAGKVQQLVLEVLFIMPHMHKKPLDFHFIGLILFRWIKCICIWAQLYSADLLRLVTCSIYGDVKLFYTMRCNTTIHHLQMYTVQFSCSFTWLHGPRLLGFHTIFCVVLLDICLFQVVNTVTSNQDCVNNIAESLVLANLLLLLHSLPSSEPVSPFSVKHKKNDSHLISLRF